MRCLTAGDHDHHGRKPVIFMDPLVARLFVGLGFDTKEKLNAMVFGTYAVMPAREFWDDQWAQTVTFSRSPSPGSSRTLYEASRS